MLKSLLLFAAALCLGLLAACAGAPTANQVTVIQSACVADSVIRPQVTALLFLATPAEVQAVNAARAVIDPICANPSGTFEANALTVFSESTAQVTTILVQLQARKSHPPTPTPAASAAVTAAR